MQETCGVVTGSFMVIGFLKGKYKDGDDDSKELTNELIQEFTSNGSRHITWQVESNSRKIILIDK